MKVSTLLRGRWLPLLVLFALAVGPTSAQGFKWWQDERFKRELRLTTEQSTRLEEIFQKSLPALRRQKAALDQAEAEFDRLVERGDDAMVMEQVGSVEAARAELSKTRTIMLLRMRRSLTADQWAKFTALHERDRGRPPFSSKK